MKLAKYGYCAVTADYLHIGHINFIEACKAKCDRLIVGIMTDECVLKYKGKRPLMNEKDRQRMIKSLKSVHTTKLQDSFDFPGSILSLKEIYGGDFLIFDCEEHARLNSDFLIPRTEGISSTLIKEQDDYFNPHNGTNYSSGPL
jgi:glycerol-3-phosphate cytidylyltransferase